MNPMVGAAAMSISSFTVCMNALRLNLFNVHDPAHDRKLKRKAPAVNEKAELNKSNEKEKQTMTKTVNIKGMMCGHCEATVKKALEAIDGIDTATVSHDAGTAVIELSKEVDEAVIKEAIEDKDFQFVSVQ